jgi:hypothetical protein
MANTVIYNKNDYVAKMRERIALPTTWNDVLDVQYNDNRTIVRAAMTTEPPVVGGTRGTAYTYEDFVLASDTQTINQNYNIPILIDEADRAQQDYVSAMNIAAYQGEKISEKLESLYLAAHSNWTDFGLTDLANTGDDDTSQITVSSANIDDIIRAIKRKLRVNNGVDFMVKNGAFIVWRPADFEALEAFVQANGYNPADMALVNGIPVEKAFHYMGVDHYMSNSHTANHVFAGIKKIGILGILRATFGKAKFIEDPGNISGLGIVSRVDYGFDWSGTTSYYKEFLMDVNVA